MLDFEDVSNEDDMFDKTEQDLDKTTGQNCDKMRQIVDKLGHISVNLRYIIIYWCFRIRQLLIITELSSSYLKNAHFS